MLRTCRRSREGARWMLGCSSQSCRYLPFPVSELADPAAKPLRTYDVMAIGQKPLAKAISDEPGAARNYDSHLRLKVDKSPPGWRRWSWRVAASQTPRWTTSANLADIAKCNLQLQVWSRNFADLLAATGAIGRCEAKRRHSDRNATALPRRTGRIPA